MSGVRNWLLAVRPDKLYHSGLTVTMSGGNDVILFCIDQVNSEPHTLWRCQPVLELKTVPSFQFYRPIFCSDDTSELSTVPSNFPVFCNTCTLKLFLSAPISKHGTPMHVQLYSRKNTHTRRKHQQWCTEFSTEQWFISIQCILHSTKKKMLEILVLPIVIELLKSRFKYIYI